MRLGLAVLSIAVIAGLAVAAGIQAQQSARVVDRTFLCSPRHGEIDVVASPSGSPEVQGASFTSSGYVRVTSGPAGDPLADLVAVARPGLRNGTTRFPAAAYASTRRCVASRASVPLRPRGVPGPPLPFRGDAECFVKGAVVVRVRAVLTTPAPWGRLRGSAGATYGGAAGQVVEAQLAVRDARAGRPLAYATLDRSGRTRLWSSFHCS